MKKIFCKKNIKLIIILIILLSSFLTITFYLIKLNKNDIPIDETSEVFDPNDDNTQTNNDFLNGDNNTEIKMSNYDKMITIQNIGYKYIFDLNMFKLFFFQKFNKLTPISNNNIRLSFSTDCPKEPQVIKVIYTSENQKTYLWSFKINI